MPIAHLQQVDGYFDNDTEHEITNRFDSIIGARTSYMQTPDHRYQSIRKTTYEDPGNPFWPPESPLPMAYTQPLQEEGEHQEKKQEQEQETNPHRGLSLRRKSYSAARKECLQTLPESGPAKIEPRRPSMVANRARSDSVVVSRIAEDEVEEYVPARAGWRRASTEDDLPSLASVRDTMFYGFYDDLLGSSKNKRETVAQSMMRRPSYY